jgi:hypothetical protein
MPPRLQQLQAQSFLSQSPWFSQPQVHWLCDGMHVDCLEQQDAPKPRSAKQKAPMANPREQARMMMLAKKVFVDAFII